MSLSATVLNAELMASEDTGTGGKPPSYRQSLEAVAPFDVITPEIIEEPEAEPEKSVLLSLADQMIWVFEGETILQRFPVSTGVPGHRTPTGEFSVRNKSPRAYSNRYECYMPNWMAITSDGLYGMHALDGTSYLSRLGSVASHGCIRLSHENALWLYNWTEIGTPVTIVDDWEEPPEEKTFVFRTGKRYCY